VKTVISFSIILCCLLATSSCKIVNYSFTGASIPLNAKTFSVPDFGYTASYVQKDLGDMLTEGLREKMLNESGLAMVSSNGDLHFEGSVSQYVLSSEGVSKNDRAAENKLTVGVQILFVNKFDEKQNYERTFSEFETYGIEYNISDVEEELLEEIVERLIDKIYLAAVANW